MWWGFFCAALLTSYIHGMKKLTKPYSFYADWKDGDGLQEGFIKAIKLLGGFVYEDPMTEGSDTFGYIMSPTKMSKKELKAYSDKMWGV